MRTEYMELKRIWHPSYSEFGATYKDLKPTEVLEIIYRIPHPLTGYFDKRCKFILPPGLSFEIELEAHNSKDEPPEIIKLIFQDRNDDTILELKINRITAINVLEEII